MSFGSYLKDLTKVFFNWWWAVITGIASFLPFFGFPGPNITVSNIEASIFIFVMFLLLFLALSVVVQGYTWYTNAYNSPVVESCIPAQSSTEQEVFLIRSLIPLNPGQIITVLRTTNRGIGCLGIIKVERVTGTLLYQCSPLWIAPIHKNDLTQNKVHVSQLSASLTLNETDLLSFANEVQKS